MTSRLIIALLIVISSGLHVAAQDSTDYKVVRKTTPKAELLSMLKPYPEAHSELVRAFRLKSLSSASVFTGAFLIGIPAGMALANKNPNWTLAGIGSGFLIASIPLHSLFNKKSDKALKMYEDEVMKPFRSRWAYGGGKTYDLHEIIEGNRQQLWNEDNAACKMID